MVSHNSFNTLKKVVAAITACLGLTACTNVNANTPSGTPSGQPTDQPASAPYNPTSPNSAPQSSIAINSGAATAKLPPCQFAILTDLQYKVIDYYFDPVTGNPVIADIVNTSSGDGYSRDGQQVCEGENAQGTKQTIAEFCASTISKQLDPDHLLC